MKRKKGEDGRRNVERSQKELSFHNESLLLDLAYLVSSILFVRLLSSLIFSFFFHAKNWRSSVDIWDSSITISSIHVAVGGKNNIKLPPFLIIFSAGGTDENSFICGLCVYCFLRKKNFIDVKASKQRKLHSGSLGECFLFTIMVEVIFSRLRTAHENWNLNILPAEKDSAKRENKKKRSNKTI